MEIKVSFRNSMSTAIAASLSSTTPLRLSSAISRATSFASTSRQLQVSRLRDRQIITSCTCPARASKLQQTHSITPIPTSTTRRWTTTTQKISLPEARRRAQATYQPPQTGLVSLLPSRLIPYAELIRLDKPTGAYYLFFPCLFSTLLAAPLTTPITPLSTIASTSALFLAGALIMRGAGCTVNDLWDRNLDPYVARTRLRPLARGALTVAQAIPFLGLQLLAGLAILVQFPTPCLYYGIPSLVLVGLYPLAKRVTNYPQFVLGLTFSWGAIMGFPALGIDLLSNAPALVAAASLYASCVAWTVVYDMIYAYQDIKDDAAAGIKSIALAQEANAKAFLSAVAGVQVVLLAGAGAAVGAGPVFFVGGCGGAAATLGWMIARVNLKSVEDCWAWFRRGAWVTGGAVSLGLLGEYIACGGGI